MPLGKRTDCGDAKYSGVQVAFASDITASLQVLRRSEVLQAQYSLH